MKGTVREIPAELKTTKVRMSPAHGLIGNGAWRNDPSNILKIGDKYHVWYARFPARGSGFPSKEEWNEICFRPNYTQIWMATSEDGHHWAEYGQVLPLSKPHAWHERCPHAPYVVPWNGKYYLFFSAYKGPRSYQRPGEKHIGLAVADQPEGPYKHVQDTPILSPSPDPKALDHYLIDDPCVIRREGKFWLYYKGRDLKLRRCWVFVAASEKITGPFIRAQAKPVSNANWHTACLWPHAEGVAGIVESACLAYSLDGLNFRLGAKIPRDLSNNSVYCPDVLDDAQKGGGITWGMCMTIRGMLGLRRFDCDLRNRDVTESGDSGDGK